MISEIKKKFKDCILNKCGYDENINKKIILAVSGGADSLSMLLLFTELIEKQRIVCAHFNHKIRKHDAERDAEFVKNTAELLGVEYISEEKNVPEIAKQNSMGLEEAARICRYEFLQKIASKYGENSLIAVAHNKGDRIETIIHNVSRGTSIDGLKGIEYRKGNIIRPLLDISRAEIESVCDYFNIKPMFDVTNNDNSYKRNKIRNVVIPFLHETFGEEIDDHILKLSDSAKADSLYLQKVTLQAYDECCGEEIVPFKRICIDFKKYFKLDSAIQNRLIRFVLGKVTDFNNYVVFPEYTGIYSDMILRVRSFASNQETGKFIEVGSGVICVLSYEKFYFTHKSLLENDNTNKNFKILVEEICAGECINLQNKDNGVEYFDAHKLEELYGKDFLEKITIKKYSTGNVYFYPFGMKGHKTLRKFLIDNKIGTFERNFVRYIAIEDDVLWIPQIRRSNIATIDKNTSRAIIIKYVSV